MSQLAQAVLATIRPNPMLGVECQGNWPYYAEFGVDVKVTSRGEVDLEDMCFFCTEEDLEEYLAYVRFQARSTPIKQVWELTKYRWDLGPELMGHEVYAL